MFWDKWLKRKPKAPAEPAAEPPAPGESLAAADADTAETEAPDGDAFAALTGEPSEPDMDGGFLDSAFDDLPDGLPDGLAATADSTEELDAQIERMLAMDGEADAAFTPRDARERVQSRAFFDKDGLRDQEEELLRSAEEREARLAAQSESAAGPPPAKQRFLKRHIENASSLRLILEGCYIALIILGLGAAAVFGARAVLTAQAAGTLAAEYTLIAQPVSTRNNTNFIFINETARLGSQTLTVNRLALDNAATLVFFQEDFDPSRYIIALYDQNRTLYHRFRQDTATGPGGGVTLKFASLNLDAAFLSLLIADPQTHESATFRYQFENPPVFPQAGYISEPPPLLDGASALQIDHAVFGSTATEIVYRYSGGVDSAAGENGALLTLYERGEPVDMRARSAVEYTFGAPDATLGKLSFAPVQNRSGSVELVFRGLFTDSDASGLSVSAESVFRDIGQSRALPVGGRDLVLEGMDLQGDYMVLVLHSEDETGARAQTDVEANLTVVTPTETLTFPGQCYSFPEGSDILFDVSGERDKLEGIPLQNYLVEFDSVRYRNPELSVTLDLSRAAPYEDIRAAAARRAVTEAFLRRLAYKSRITGADGVFGFTEAVLADRVLARAYAPMNAGTPPMYSAAVVSGALPEPNRYIAVVEEDWIAEDSERLNAFNQSHQVTAEFINGQWVITEDMLIDAD